ncbi:tetratricopeptide repeat protein [Thiovibrio sp. JS02]
MELVTANDLNAGIIELRNAIQIDPKFAEGRYRLGLAYLKKGEIAEAFKQLERAASLDPKNHDALLKTAELLFLAKKYKESREKVEALLSDKKDFPEALALLAQLELTEGNVDKSEEAIQSAIRLNPRENRFYLVQTQILASAKKFAEAEASAQKAIELAPKLVNYKSLVALYMNQGKVAEAEQTLKSMTTTFPDDPGPYLDMANFSMNQGDVPGAEKNILAAIERKKDSADLHVILASFYQRTGQLDKVDAAYQKALGLSEKPEDIKALLADFHFETGKHDIAGKEVAEITGKNAKHPLANLVKAKLLLKENKNTDALAILDNLIKEQPSWGEAYYLKGVAHFNKGEALLSQSAVESAVKYMPNNPDPHTLLAYHLLLKREFEGAGQEASKALRLKPNNYRAAIILGQTFLGIGETDKAAKLFEAMNKQAPENTEILYNMAMAYLAAKDVKKAETALEGILTLQPNHSPSLAILTAMYTQQNDWGKAVRRVKEQLGKTPDNPHTHILLARLLGQKKDSREEALELLRKAEKINPDIQQIYVMTAQLLSGMGKIDAAIDEYRALLAKNHAFPQGHMALGSLLEQKGDVAGALASYQEALKLKPDFAAAANNLAWLLSQGENPDLGEALRLALLAKEKFPNDPYIADTLGWVHYKRGSYKLALTQFAMAAEKVSDHPTIRYHLALALKEDGQTEQAKKEIERCLAGKADFQERADAEKLLKELS